MKNNILIIALVSIVTIVIIAAVILASVLNSSKDPSDSDSESSDRGSSYQTGLNFPSDSSDPDVSSDVSDLPDSALGLNIMNTAKSVLDREPAVPFLENGASLDGFDNSGFIYYVLRENGFMTCPRGLADQTKMAGRLEFNELRRGDLVFFRNEGEGDGPGYGGIYIGDRKMIACLMPGTFVQEVDISDKYYEEMFYCGVGLS